MRSAFRALVAAGALAAASQADAQVVRFNAAAQGWFGYCYYGACYGPAAGLFSLDAQIGYHFLPELEAGGRVGLAFYLLGPVGYAFGVPLDLYARLTVGHRYRLYLEAAGGPWLVFSPDVPLLVGHGEFGIGLTRGGLSFGLQAGWLFDTYMAGVRFGVRL